MEKKEKDFLLGGKDRKGFSICLSKFSSVVGVAWLLTYSAFAYQFGISVLSLGIGLILGFILLIFWVSPKISKYINENQIYNLNSLILYKTKSEKLKNLYIFISNISMFLILCSLVVGGASILSINYNINYFLSTIIIVFICLVYLIYGGFKSVIKTDIIQGLIISIFFIFFIFSIFFKFDSSNITAADISSPSILMIFGFFIYGLFANLNNPVSYQLLFSAKNRNEFKKGFLYFLIPYILMMIAITIISLYVKGADSSLVPENTLIYFFSLFDSIFLFLMVFFYICILSTFDSYMYALSSHMKFLKKDKVKNVILNMILLSLIILIISNIFTNFLNFSIFVYGFVLTTSIPMIYFIYSFDKKISNSKFFFSIIFSLFSFILGALVVGLRPELAPIPLIFGAFGLLIKNKKVENYFQKS